MWTGGQEPVCLHGSDLSMGTALLEVFSMSPRVCGKTTVADSHAPAPKQLRWSPVNEGKSQWVKAKLFCLVGDIQ